MTVFTKFIHSSSEAFNTYKGTDPGDIASLYCPKMNLLSEELLQSRFFALGVCARAHLSP